MGIPTEATRPRWAKILLQDALQHLWRLSIGFPTLRPLSNLRTCRLSWGNPHPPRTCRRSIIHRRKRGCISCPFVWEIRLRNRHGVADRLFRQTGTPGYALQARKIRVWSKTGGKNRGSILQQHLTTWGFTPTSTDSRVLLAKYRQEVIIFLIVVNDMVFARNSQLMLDALKKKMSTAFEVTLFGKSTNFIEWETQIDRTGIEIGQQTHIQFLFKKYKMDTCNAILDAMATNANLPPSQPNDKRWTQWTTLCIEDKFA